MLCFACAQTLHATTHIITRQKHTSNRCSCLLTVCVDVQMSNALMLVACFVTPVGGHLPLSFLPPPPLSSPPPAPPVYPPTNLTSHVNVCRQDAEDLLTTAAAVAAARAQASADEEEADMASALTAVCQVATNALEVRAPHLLCALLHSLSWDTDSQRASPCWPRQLLKLTLPTN